MKTILLFFALFLLGSCTIDNREAIVIDKIERYGDHCIYYYNEQEDVAIIDDCNKFNIGDTVQIKLK